MYPEVEKIFKEYPHRGPRLLYQNLHDGRFREVTAQIGLGEDEKADVIEIRWPSGQTETLKNIVANQILTVKEKSEVGR